MRSVRILTTAGLAAVLLAGCGDSGTTPGSGNPGGGGLGRQQQPASNGVADLSANEILTKAKAAFSKATSVHMSGGGSSDGDEFALDMRIKKDAGGFGSLTTEGVKLEVVKIGPDIYLKAPDSYWRDQAGNATAASLLRGKYLKGTSKDPQLASIGNFADLSGFASQVLSPDGTITKGERKTVNGVEAIGLIDPGKDGGVLYIALSGEPYPVQLAPTDEAGQAGDSGSLNFTEYGEDVELTPPPADQVVDVSQLGR